MISHGIIMLLCVQPAKCPHYGISDVAPRFIHTHTLTDRMLARIADEYLLEVRAANGQHDLVRLQQLSIAGESYIDQIATIVQVLESGGDVVLEIVPAQREFVVHSGGFHFTTLTGALLYLLFTDNTHTQSHTNAHDKYSFLISCVCLPPEAVQFHTRLIIWRSGGAHT